MCGPPSLGAPAAKPYNIPDPARVVASQETNKLPDISAIKGFDLDEVLSEGQKKFEDTIKT